MTFDSSSKKFCRDCEHLLGLRQNIESIWNCAHPNNVESETIDLVYGLIDRKFKWSIHLLRLPAANLMCGEEGKWWEEYIRPSYSPPNKLPSKSKYLISADDL